MRRRKRAAGRHLRKRKKMGVMDLILVLDSGAVADAGTHEELLSRCAIYQEVYESQVKGGDPDGE